MKYRKFRQLHCLETRGKVADYLSKWYFFVVYIRTLTAVLSSRTNFENLKLTPNFFLILSISSDVRPSGGIPVIC